MRIGEERWRVGVGKERARDEKLEKVAIAITERKRERKKPFVGKPDPLSLPPFLSASLKYELFLDTDHREREREDPVTCQ